MTGQVNNQEAPKRSRAALYVDGFNLYHAIERFEEPFLKWINLWNLGELLIPKKTHELVLAKLFTAKRDGDAQSDARRITFINAMRAAGVKDVQGHYLIDPRECLKCGHTWKKPTEKQTDINLALAVIMDGLDDQYDYAYLLSADSDQAATARAFRERLPDKTLINVIPPGQTVSAQVMRYAHEKIILTKDHIERVVMGAHVKGFTDNLIRRPDGYAPPEWWVHPDQRPQKNKTAP